MAGLGRRTHYRKHLTDAVLHDLPEPNFDDGDRIAKVVATRGSNQFDVHVAAPGRSVSKRGPQLAILPTKFRKLVWVKRGDYVMVKAGEEGEDSVNNTGIRYIITHILYKDQVKHLRAMKLWPTDKEFRDEANEGQIEQEEATSEDEREKDQDTSGSSRSKEDEDGIVYASDKDDDFLINTNRIAALQIQDSESESSDEDE